MFCFIFTGIIYPAFAADYKDPPETITNKDDTKVIDKGKVKAVVLQTSAVQNRAWLEAKSESGKTAKYVPVWKKDGQDKEMVKAISKLNAGDRLEIEWFVDDHLRLKSIKTLGAAEKEKGKPKTEKKNKSPGSESYDLVFSTYIGGSDWEHARDVFADSQGNIYITGGTASTDFPTTPGAYCTKFNGGGKDSPGMCDVFVMKFGPTGELIWSTLLGGPNYDRAYGIEVDEQGYVYVCGRAGTGFPTTKGAFQPDFNGSKDPSSSYGKQNGFVAKLSPDGSQLIWASYVGSGELCRDIALDDAGNIYLPLCYRPGNGTTPLPSAWFANSFQKAPKGGTECGAIKISNDGKQVIWATYLGGTKDDSGEASIRVDVKGNVYLGIIYTSSTDLPVTPGAFSRTYNGGDSDGYVAKISPDGSNLIFGTYLGGSDMEYLADCKNLALDARGNVYVSLCTKSTDFRTTPGAFRTERTCSDKEFEFAVVKLSPTGSLLASTFMGGTGPGEGGIYVDSSENILLTGDTRSVNFPVTDGAYQPVYGGGGGDAIIVRLAADFSRQLYATFMGGSAFDACKACFLDGYGNIYITGASDGPGWPVKNAFQAKFAGCKSKALYGSGDLILAKFKLIAMPEQKK